VNSRLDCGFVSKKAEGFSAKPPARARGGRLGQVSREQAEPGWAESPVVLCFEFFFLFIYKQYLILLFLLYLIYSSDVHENLHVILWYVCANIKIIKLVF